MDLERRVTQAWYGKPGMLRALAPLEWLYRSVAQQRRKSAQHNDSDSPPVIVVGNITVGGSGKTPLVIAVVKWLQSQGRTPGVVSRGYGSNAPGYPFLVDSQADPAVCGDEPCLIAGRTAVPVVISPDRPVGVQRLAELGCDVVVSDDGLQHYAMARAFEIVVLDGARGLGNGHCLPVGPLREPVSRLESVDAVVINGEARGADMPAGMHMQLQPGLLQALRSGEQHSAAEWPAAKRRVHAVAGIGNPARFFDTLRSLGFDPVEHAFPDHFSYDAASLNFGDELPVLMTEKDAVKCQGFAGPDWWYLPVDATVDELLFQRIAEVLAFGSESAES